MPRGETIDTGMVHKLLWARADRLGRLKVMQKDLAEEIGITKFTMSRVFSRMEEDGRLRKLQGHKGNTWTYAIKDPKSWK